ncbi:hypothetical protein AAFF_G00019050 [Aldrovandia affinis]|uniref:Uncharacterized protein n=1 Tax=Aldrovandia affinis TaxID=143900 RepID=A0AAD7WGV6_9TELE|nr:hypothetical protein AAFF_G00019050 [Aldrovandia affinis]
MLASRLINVSGVLKRPAGAPTAPEHSADTDNRTSPAPCISNKTDVFRPISRSPGAPRITLLSGGSFNAFNVRDKLLPQERECVWSRAGVGAQRAGPHNKLPNPGQLGECPSSCEPLWELCHYRSVHSKDKQAQREGSLRLLGSSRAVTAQCKNILKDSPSQLRNETFWRIFWPPDGERHGARVSFCAELTAD